MRHVSAVPLYDLHGQLQGYQQVLLRGPVQDERLTLDPLDEAARAAIEGKTLAADAGEGEV
ncbi:MAG TPA: hypothetical protein VNQ99_06215 [Xanthobacteraceae bacterium]|nr:hypothetical protein [Xanthobacteraceae bacterium]